MASSQVLRRVTLVRTDVSEELSASFIRVTRIGELGTKLVTASVVPSSPILVTLMKEALSSSETSVLTRTTRRNIPEDAILHSHCRENLESYLKSSDVQYMSLVIAMLHFNRGPLYQWPSNYFRSNFHFFQRKIQSHAIVNIFSFSRKNTFLQLRVF
jgi:hypothetical protein